MFGSDMGKTLLVLLHAVWEDPCNAAEVIAIGDGDTLTVNGESGGRRLGGVAATTFRIWGVTV